MPPTVAATAVLAALPAVVVAASGRDAFAGALSAASLLAGAGVGYVADDPAAPTLESSPTTLIVRRALRAAVIVAALGAGWLAAVLVATWYGRTAPDASFLAAELCATAALSAAFASRVPTHAAVSTGFASATAALLTMVSTSALAYRWQALPTLGSGGAAHHRWWWIAVLGFVVAAWSSRDPAARATRRSRRWPTEAW